jgi:hypothetical protein
LYAAFQSDEPAQMFTVITDTDHSFLMAPELLELLEDNDKAVSTALIREYIVPPMLWDRVWEVRSYYTALYSPLRVYR